MWKIKTKGEVEVFAGCERVDGNVKDCRFQQPMGFTPSLKVSFTSVMLRQILSRFARWSSVLNFQIPLVNFMTAFLSIAKEQPFACPPVQ